MSQHTGHVTSSLETSFTCHAPLGDGPFDWVWDQDYPAPEIACVEPSISSFSDLRLSAAGKEHDPRNPQAEL